MKIEVRLRANGLVENIEKTEKSDWIAAQQQKSGKIPALPDTFLSLVNNYEKGKPISPDIEVIPISGQQWAQLTVEEKTQLLELVEFTGQSAETYCRNWQSMLPRDPMRRQR